MATDARTWKPSGRAGWIAALLPLLLLVGIMGFFFATRFTEATSALKSVRAVVVVGGLTVAALLLAFLLYRFVPWIWVRAGVLCAAVLVFAFYFVLPGYQDKTVVERASDVLGAAVVRPVAESPAPPAGEAPPPIEPVATGPVQVTMGVLEGIDHRASGAANLIRREDGRFVIELRDIDIQNGPDYDVFLVEGTDRQGIDDGVRIDDLKGNLGTQYYDVDENVDPGAGWTVLIWCQTFGVPVANATQVTA